VIDRRLLIHFDWTLLGITFLIASIGILNLYSTTGSVEISGTPLYLKQIFWLLIALTMMIIVAFIEYRFFSDVAYIFYAIALVLLLGVMGYGIITSGAQRWMRIGPLSFQPSEFVKISCERGIFLKKPLFAFRPPFYTNPFNPQTT